MTQQSASPKVCTGWFDCILLLQEAFDIFGDVGELLDIYDQRKREETDGAEEELEPDFSDEEAAETFRVEQVTASISSQENSQALCPLSIDMSFMNLTGLCLTPATIAYSSGA